MNNYLLFFNQVVNLLEFVIDFACKDGYISSLCRKACQEDLDYVVMNFDPDLFRDS